MLPVFVFGHYLSTRDSACSRGAIAHRPINASKWASEAMKVGLCTHIALRLSQGCREAPECVLVGGEIRQWGSSPMLTRLVEQWS